MKSEGIEVEGSVDFVKLCRRLLSIGIGSEDDSLFLGS